MFCWKVTPLELWNITCAKEWWNMCVAYKRLYSGRALDLDNYYELLLCDASGHTKKKFFCHRHCKYNANLQNSKLLGFFWLFKNLYFYFIWGLWRCHLCWPVISWLKNKGWNISCVEKTRWNSIFCFLNCAISPYYLSEQHKYDQVTNHLENGIFPPEKYILGPSE